MIEKELADDKREHLDPNHVVMENNCMNLVRDPYDGLNLKQNNRFWGDEDNPLGPHHEEFTLVKKMDREDIYLLSLEWKLTPEP